MLPDELRAIEMTGGIAVNLAEAIDQWEKEREALAELHDENQAFEIMFRRFDVSIALAERVLGEMEIQVGMFITQDTRDRIESFRDQLRKFETHREHGRELVLNAKMRRVAE